MRNMALLTVLWLTVAAGCASHPPAGDALRETQRRAIAEAEVDLGRFFTNGIEGTFVLLDEQGRRILRHNPARAAQRFTPASTFKILNALIALDTGVADGSEFTLPYDATIAPPRPWWPESWQREQTLRTAIRESVYWYFQEIARRVGETRMQAYLRQFDYGNMDPSSGLDRFWLEGSLKVSPDEQVRFLQRLYHGRLGVSARATDLLKEMIVLEDGPDYTLSGKTGTAEVTPTRELGWLVGYLERDQTVWFYALNMEGERVWEDWPPRARREVVLRILRELQVLPASG